VDVAALITETGFSGLDVKCIATVPCQAARINRILSFVNSRAESEARAVARGKIAWCGEGKAQENFLRCFLKEANEGLLRISRGVSFHVKGYPG